MARSLSKNLFNILFCTFTFIICALTLYPQPSVYAADVTLAWTSNTEGDLDGYYIYYKTGTPGEPYNGTGVEEGSSPIKITIEESLANSATPEYTLHGLSDTETSYLVLTAYDTEGNESLFSNEVSYQPSTAPTLSSLSISGDSSVNEDSSASYTATATFSDGSKQTVSNSATWSDDSSYASINNSGVLSALEVSEDTSVTIQASYILDGITKTATQVVNIVDVTVPITLSSLSIIGDNSVNEDSSASYTARATFSNGSIQTVSSSAVWSDDSSYASINNSGVLSTSEVSEDTTVTIQASYSFDGITKTAIKMVNIADLTVPVTLSSLSISGSDFVSENNSTGYVATATFSDDTTQAVTGNTSWSENSGYAGINSSGVLTASEVTEDSSVIIQAGYTIGGVTKTATKVMTILDVPVSNLSPDTPNIVYPENYSGDVEVPLVITTAAFSDPNNDGHIQSQWQISEQSNFSTLVVDITSDNYLTTFPVPHTALKSNQKYYVRVRFFDIYSAASNWSGTVEFTTAFFIVDININGISDADEVDDSVDFNLDGIPDNDQPQIIKCIRASDGSVSIGIERASSSVEEIESLEVIDPDTISNTVNRPADLIFGLVAYRLRVTTPGDTATIRIYFSGGIFASDVFYKYDTINGWYDYSEHTTFNDDGQSVTLELKDGGYGDSDGLANGVIVDPGGIASGGSESTYTDSGVDIGGIGGGGGCFIATASFGSKFEKHVQLLRRFRDLYLMPNRIGRTFVNAYYRYSPPMADFIAGHDTLRAMVRYSLVPLFGLSWLLLHFGMAPTLLFMVLMGFTTFLCYRKIPTS